MNPQDRALAIAARIADGSEIDWPALASTAVDRIDDPLLAELKSIAELATLHRAPVRGVGDPAPSRWGNLTLLDVIGEGRFGRVYRAWDTRLQRQVALKVLHAPSSEAESPTRVIEEARLLARVRHPNVLTVHGAEVAGGEVGIWTEFIEGRTLEAIVRDSGPLPVEQATSIGVDLCRALAAVHAAGLLHRDIKAQNVMRETGGRIVLMDFGAGHDLQLLPPRPGDLSGTPLYLAPEIFEGGRPSIASDVYSLSVLLFHLLTGSHPVSGRTLDDVRAGHRGGRIVRLRDVRPDGPAPLVTVIERGLANDPAERYDNAAVFERALTAVNLSSRRSGFSLMTAVVFAAVALAIVAAGVIALNGGGLRDRIRRTFLGAAAVDQGRPAVRRIRTPDPSSTMSRPSHDGRYFSFVDTKGNVIVWDAPANKADTVVAAGAEVGLSSLMSPDGAKVAYASSSSSGASYQLSVVQRNGLWPETIVGRETVYEPEPIDWSGDGRDILCLFKQKDGQADLVLQPAEGGSPRRLMTFEKDAPEEFSLSRDGRFVVYFAKAGNSETSPMNLMILATNGAEPIVLFAGGPHDSSPVWTPDGGHVFFLRRPANPGGPTDGWILPVEGRAATGDASRVIQGIGRAFNVSISESGALAYTVLGRTTDIYTASIDDTRIGDPTRVSSSAIGEHVGPAWSPDGESIAYFTTAAIPGQNEPQRTLTILDIRSGQERSLRPALSNIDGYAPHWLPDSKSVVVASPGPSRDRFGYYRVDVQTSATKFVVAFGPDSTPGFFECSPDGQSLMFVDPARGIVAHPFSGGPEPVVAPQRSPWRIGRFLVSPDGSALAISREAGPEDAPDRQMFEVQVIGGASHELVLAGPRGWAKLQSWIQDSQELVFATYPQNTQVGHFWRIAASGEVPPRDFGWSVNGNTTNPVSLSPDGKRIAYTEQDRFRELWVRDGFMSTLASAPATSGPRINR